jgi:hypothetical protein
VGAAGLHMVFGWSLMLLGGLSGAAIGLRFHTAGWAGGYGSFRRRLMRLGHIAFFGLGILNVLFALAISQFPVAGDFQLAASTGFIIAGIGMPMCCFLSAWQERFRHLFFVPVLGVLVGVMALLLGWNSG